MISLVTIIIPTYNRDHLIAETLDSILAQTYTNWECIIIDDESTDNTENVLIDYVKKDSRFRYFRRAKEFKKGANGCRNYGYKLSKGEYVKWFDSDDIMMPNLLEKQIEGIRNADLNICEILKFDFQKDIILGKSKIQSDRLIENYFTGEVAFYICGPLWRKSFLNKQQELFDGSISNLDDWDFNLRMLYQNPLISYTDEPLIKYRIHDKSLSKEIDKLNIKELKSEFSAIEKHLWILRSQQSKYFKDLHKQYIVRCKYVFKETVLANNKNKYYFLCKLLSKQSSVFDIKGMMHSIMGITLYTVFKKGYKFL